VFLEVAGYLVDRWSLQPEHIIATFWVTRKLLTPEVLEKIQGFLQDECGTVMTGTVSHPDEWAGPVFGEGVPANGN
jgi:hypothetical protein